MKCIIFGYNLLFLLSNIHDMRQKRKGLSGHHTNNGILTFIILNSEIGAHVRSNLCYLTWHLGIEQSQTRFFSLKKTAFIHVCATRSELPSNISNMITLKIIQSRSGTDSNGSY